jgi:hypothetical protein
MTNATGARREIAMRGYATPTVLPHVESRFGALARGASSALDPFRSSLPSIYSQVPSWLADTVALRGDWAIYGMDFWHVLHALDSTDDQEQGSLFDPRDFES